MLKLIPSKLISLVFLIYAIGALGIIIPLTHSVFVFLTPFALLFSAFLLIQEISWSDNAAYKTRSVFFGTVVYLTAFCIEVIGVNTGWPFGTYHYKCALGPKIVGTPLLIGINWWLLVYCSAALFNKVNNIFLRIVAASLAMTAFDFIMEQVACETQMWCWQNNHIPVQNYISWFVIALIFHCIKIALGLIEKSILARTLFVAQLGYFALIFAYYKLIPLLFP